MAPVRVEALALRVTTLPVVALMRSPAPAFALAMLKLSKVATALVALAKSIAFAAAETVPPPEARIDGEAPLNAKAEEDACEVVTLSAPDAVTAPESACTPLD